jgi:hypothetical protein
VNEKSTNGRTGVHAQPPLFCLRATNGKIKYQAASAHKRCPQAASSRQHHCRKSQDQCLQKRLQARLSRRLQKSHDAELPADPMLGIQVENHCEPDIQASNTPPPGLSTRLTTCKSSPTNAPHVIAPGYPPAGNTSPLRTVAGHVLPRLLRNADAPRRWTQRRMRSSPYSCFLLLFTHSLCNLV